MLLPTSTSTRLLALCWVLAAGAASAKGLTFGLAGKSLDVNFVAAWTGCQDEAQKNGDRCLQIGEDRPARARVQDRAILKALQQPLAGLAVSVTQSPFLAASSLARAAQLHVPIVTFDSDLPPSHQHLRRSYVGPDNVEFGRLLARLVQERRPKGGVVCIMSGDPVNPNLIERQLGLRQGFSGKSDWPGRAKLQGQGGWTEHERCPWDNGDDNRRALIQMKASLSTMKLDSFISVGQWPVDQPPLYRQAIESLREPGIGLRVAVGIGEATKARIQLIKDGLVQGYVSIDFSEVGRASYRTLKAIAEGRSVPNRVITPLLTYQLDRTKKPTTLKVQKSLAP